MFLWTVCGRRNTLDLFFIWRSIIPVSILSIFAIAVDRFLMVAYPFKHKSLTNGKRIGFWIILFWMLPLCNIREFFLPGAVELLEVDSTYVYAGVTLTCLAGLLYVMTTRSLRIQARNLESHNPDVGLNRTQAVRASRERRFVKTIALVACIAVIGVIPFLTTYKIVKKEIKRLGYRSAIDILFRFSFALFYSTFAVNPLIYFLRLTNYRKTFLALYWGSRAR